MKMMLLSSFACLALGFFLGRVESGEAVPSPDPAVTSSSRRVERSNSHSKRVVSLRSEKEGLSRLLEKVEAFPESEISAVRLHAWILQLGLDEIPEALEIFQERARIKWEEEGNMSFGSNEVWNGRKVSLEETLLLTRWYELGGEEALGWIRDQKVWPIAEVLQLEIRTIEGGYSRDPQRGFELCLEFLERIKEVEMGNREVFRDLILYQVGKWGQEPVGMLEEVDPDGALREVKEFSSFPSEHKMPPAYWPHPAMKALAQGLVDSGREGLAVEMSKGLEGGARLEFNEVLGSQAEELGWEEVKRGIDGGVIEGYGLTFEVLNEMAVNGREEALDWYLSLDHGEYSSRDQEIALLVSEDGPFAVVDEESDGPFSGGAVVDLDATADWLTTLEAQGEPVGKAWAQLAREALGEREWERVRTYAQRLSPERWRALEEEIIGNAITEEVDDFAGESLPLLRVKGYGMGDRVAREFGLLDRVEERISNQNQETRAKLQKILDEME